MHKIIRLATEEDFPAIHSLILEFAVFQKTPHKMTVTLQEMQRQKAFFQCFVAENKSGEIIGFASFYYTYFSWSGKGIYLDDLYVREMHRGQKTGAGLLNAVINLAKQAECKKLRWQVSSWNANAIVFYKKMGAIVDDTEINCDLDLLSHSLQSGIEVLE